jgi:hypothetical protein
VSDTPIFIYLEADDEITTVVRRVRDAGPGRIVVVAPGRSRAISSSVALRLLARAAELSGREISVVGDALTRSLAAEAGLATYATVDDARRAEPVAGEPTELHHAAIHVIRGPLSDDTVPKVAAVAAAGDETVVVPVPRPPTPSRRKAAPHRPARRRVSWFAAVGGIVAVLVAWGVIAALILPAATIQIVPRTEAIGPVADVIAINDPEQLMGTVEEAVTVSATGTYEANEAATGRVTFFNWNFEPVEVPTGSLVAAGEQAFETLDVIIVPAGRFDPFGGGITAGEAGVGVRASATGPDANVPAEAIDTVLDPGLRNELRGFPTITERLVTNPEPTTGGSNETGPEITQDDVDAAVAALNDALEAAVDEALAESTGMVSADSAEPATPQIEIPEDLVGRRDAESVELGGSLAYDRLAVDEGEVTGRAVERFNGDGTLVPDGSEIVASATRVTIGEVRRDGGSLLVDVNVAGRSTPTIERATVLERIIGLSRQEAEAALADLGAATVELWPAWVGSVPDSDWRIDLQVAEPGP